MGQLCLGVECGRNVSPCPHAHSTTTVDFTMARKTTSITPAWILLSPRLCKSTHALSTTQASRIAVHPLAGAEVAHIHALLATGILAIVCSLLSRPGFSWLLPTQFSSADLRDSGCIFTSRADLWVLCCCFSHVQAGRTVISSLAWSV